ncbi:MAG: hypothetical protein ABIP33_00625 [Pseudolysinimonas sp.]
MRRRVQVVIAGAAVAVLAIVAVAVLTFPRPVGRGTAQSIELPQELEQMVFSMCAPGLPVSTDPGSTPDGSVLGSFVFGLAGSGSSFSVRIELPGKWSVSVNHSGASMQNESSDPDVSHMVTQASFAIPAAQSMYNCMSPYRFADHEDQPPTSSSQLLQLYRYETTVLWPCMTSHGIKMGAPPSRDQFVNSFTALTADPIAAMTPTPKQLPRLVSALEACPLRPAYLG